MKYRKKPVVIEAMKFTYPPTEEFIEWAGGSLGKLHTAYHPNAVVGAEILTLKDGHDNRVKHIATEGDYIIKGIQGEFYPCKPDIFKATYDLISEE